MSKPSFYDLGISKDTSAVLLKKGYEFPTDIQAALIPAFSDTSQDIIAQADTGTGKTGAFGIPLIDTMNEDEKFVQAIAIAPTRELASQVAKELSIYKGQRKIDIIECCGGQGMREQIEKLKKSKRACIVVGTPGRILDHINKKRLNLRKISYLIIDEVDEMLNFGFKEDMDAIVDSTNPDRRTIILSATLPKFVMKVANSYLDNPMSINTTSKASGQKPQIEQTFYKCDKINKVKLLSRVIDSFPEFYGFIFCNTKREVDQLAATLINHGYSVECMHGDLSQAQRERSLAKFKTKQCDILVVTDVAARGIDVKNISHVINYSVPQNTEVYTHRIGRTGRAGQSGVSITFVKEREFFKFKRIIKQQKGGIHKKEVPSAADVLDNKKAKFLTDVSKCEPKSFHLDMAQSMLRSQSPEDALAAVLKLRCSDLFNKSNY